MASLQLAAHFPSIDQLNLSARKKKCSYWLKDQRHCSRGVKLDSIAAIRLQEELVLTRGAEDPSTLHVRSSLIEELLPWTCCWQHKPMILPNTYLGREIRRRWRDQLKDATLEHSVIENEADPTSSVASERLSALPAESSTIPQAIPRYNTRLTRQFDPSDVRRTDSAAPAPALGFLSMKEPGRTVGQKLLSGPASDEARRTRDLYAFARLSSPGYLKIGVAVNVKDRLRRWSRKCLYEPVLKHHLQNVPYAQFIEGLIHSELLRYWRREMQCKHNPNCITQHKEWFQVDDETAFRVMDRWVEWMNVAEPFDDRSLLKPEWRLVIENLEKNGIPVTSQLLLNALEDSRVNITAPIADDAVAAPTANTTAQSAADRTPEAPVNTVTPVPATIDVPVGANLLSTVADIILSLTPEQTYRLRALLDQGTRNNIRTSLPPTVPIVSTA